MKNYSHAIITKILAFVLVILCFTGLVTSIVQVENANDGDFGIIFEDNYFHSRAYIRESRSLVNDLTRLLGEYKNEEHIASGGTISEEEWSWEERQLFSEYQYQSPEYSYDLTEKENFERFKEVYANQLAKAREQLIQNDLKTFHRLLQSLNDYENRLFYASDGVHVFTNTPNTEKEQFRTYPSYMMFGEYKTELYPKEVKENQYLYKQITEPIQSLDPKSMVVYIAFTQEFLDQNLKEWQENKAVATQSFYRLLGFLTAGILSFLYLVIVMGRTSFKDQEVSLNPLDKLFTDVKLGLCVILLAFWAALLDDLNDTEMMFMVIPITITFATVGLMLVLSLVRHWKNGTLIKHSLVFRILYTIYKFVRNIYDSGSVGIKTVLIVIGYPLIVALTFFMFPVTLGIAAWFALKKVKSFQVIQEGVEKIKDGDLHHRIDVGSKGEFSRLAANINGITDGLKKAVDNELKSERLKTELITNVSHDIRTPLTSIITYVDLLKKEKDPSKVEEYIEVLDQKSKRLKVLTDDLFEAAKASSGNIPVQFERINIVSLISQGLGEVNEKIESLDLEVKFNHPKEKVYVTADGKLLWRSIENLLSNIFKYTLKGSRVYIDIEDAGDEILLTFKNISAYELNISAEDLMERFTRGDEARSSEGSGLGLSIAKSLIEIQKGRFYIQVDGDLFKSMIYMRKHLE